MEKLSGLDAAFLAFERAENPMNVMGTVVLQPAGNRRTFVERILPELLKRRIPEIRPLRRRIVEMPFGLGHPVWVEDPDFDVADHIRNVRLPSPGSDRLLAAFVERQAALPLHRSRPLWELTIVDGLTQKRVALVFRFHHAAVDGVSCAAMLGHLVDAVPDSVRDPQRAEPGDGEHPPSAPELLANEVVQWPRRLRLLRAVVGRGVRAAAESVERRARGGASPDVAIPFAGPRTVFNRALSARRTVVFSRAKRADVQFVRRVFGGTGNDIVLAACTETLRNYLAGHGGIPDGPLVAAIPCSVRCDRGEETFGNRISAFLVHLPVHLEDRVERLLAIRSETRMARAENGRVAGSHLVDWAELAPAGLLKLGGSVFGSSLLERKMAPLCNVVISNVPGPRTQITLGGARLEACYPHGPLLPGVGLNLTVMSHDDVLSFGLLACRRAVPDAEDIALGFGAAIGALRKRALNDCRGELRFAG